MKVTLSREQLDNAVMIGEKRKSIEVIVGGKVMRLGYSKFHDDTKKLITESYPHLILHNASSYTSWGCRCETCKKAEIIRSKPKSGVMKITLTREQLDTAVMVKKGLYNKIEVIIDNKIMRLGSKKLHKDTKQLIIESYPHLILHNASSYNDWGCRCLTCKKAESIRAKPKSAKIYSIRKANLKDRIMKELNLSSFVCSSCQSKTNLEADHTDASKKLMDIDSFNGYLNKLELKDFIITELNKCQVLCYICHNQSKSRDGRIGRARNRTSTPWLIARIDGKRNKWTPTQIIPLLKMLNYKPGDKPKPLNDYGWLVYRLYAHSINKPFI